MIKARREAVAAVVRAFSISGRSGIKRDLDGSRDRQSGPCISARRAL